MTPYLQPALQALLLLHTVTSQEITRIPLEGLDDPYRGMLVQKPAYDNRRLQHHHQHQHQHTYVPEEISIDPRGVGHSASQALMNEIETTFAGGSGQCGNMFDVYAFQDLTIVDMDIHILEEEEVVEVFGLLSSFVGHESDAHAWTQLCIGTVQGQGFEQRTPLPSGCLSSVHVHAGDTVGFYVTVNRSKMAYTFVQDMVLNDVYASNVHLQILLGVGKAYPFAYTFNPRLWNGVIKYLAESSSEEGEGEDDVGGAVSSESADSTPPPSAQVVVPTPVPVVDPAPVPQPNADDNGMNSLETTYVDSSGQGGNMFDVVALKDVTIHSMNIHIVEGTQNLELYIRDGTYEGSEQNPMHWNLIASTSIEGMGVGIPTEVPTNTFSPVEIYAGMTKAWYVTIQNPEMRYSGGSGTAGNIFAHNGDLQILEGVGNVYPFGATFFNRVWNGSLKYTKSESHLSTTFTGGSGQAGVMFDVAATKSLVLESFQINCASDTNTTQHLMLFTKKDSYRTHQKEPDSWSLLSDLQLTCNGEGIPTPLPTYAFMPLGMNAGDKRGFYITFEEPVMVYSSGSDVGAIAASNSDLAILEGCGNEYLFGSYFEPRKFNGAVIYSLPHNREIATNFDGGSGQSGIMFDIVTKNPVTIYNLDIHLVSEDQEAIEIWTKEGSHIGYEHDSRHWTHIAYVDLYAPGFRVSLPPGSFEPILLEKHSRQAFYITANSPVLRYGMGESLSHITFQNPDIAIYDGTGIEYPFGEKYVPRAWNGAFFYKVSGHINPTLNRELVTTFLGGSGQAGIMFDIVAKRDIQIYDFDLHLVSALDTEHIKVFIRKGTHEGYTDTAAAWSLIGSTNVQPQHRRTSIPVGTFDPFVIEKSTRMAIYVTATNPAMRYSGGNAVGDVFASNDDLYLLEGTGKAYPFQEDGDYAPRVFNGSVRYTVLED